MLSKVIIYFIISCYGCILCCLCPSLKLTRNTANLSVCSDPVLRVRLLWVPQPRNSTYRGCPLCKTKRQLLACAPGVAVVGVVINEERKKKKCARNNLDLCEQEKARTEICSFPGLLRGHQTSKLESPASAQVRPENIIFQEGPYEDSRWGRASSLPQTVLVPAHIHP